MSRTCRRALVQLDLNDRPLDVKKWTFDEAGEHIDYYSRRNCKYDHKSWEKSPSVFKKMRQRHRKAKIRQAMADGKYDKMPRFKKENDWLWN